MTPNPCPDCGAGLLERARSCKCGWKATPTASTSAARPTGPDPDWGRCADVFLGQRCTKAGALSHGTFGGGPWYCGVHFHKEAPIGDSVKPPGGFRTIKSLVDPLTPKREVETVGQREPGSDDE